MTNKHTTGQWIASPEGAFNEWGVDAGVWGICICADAPGDGSPEANARLIAAAPELLDIAQSIIVDDMLEYLPDEYVLKVRAVIAKATGA